MVTSKRLALSPAPILVHKSTVKGGARIIFAPSNNGQPVLIGGPGLTPSNGYPLLRRDADVHRTIHIEQNDEIWALAPVGSELAVLIVEPGT